MNGAKADPSAMIKSPPSINITIKIGVSHNFFLILRKKKNSLIISI